MMNFFVILLFASSSTSPQGYFPLPQPVLYPLQYASTATLCALPPCPEPIRADDPLQAVLDYDCKATGFFPDQESGCQKFFQCVQQGENLRVSFNTISLIRSYILFFRHFSLHVALSCCLILVWGFVTGRRVSWIAAHHLRLI